MSSSCLVTAAAAAAEELGVLPIAYRHYPVKLRTVQESWSVMDAELRPAFLWTLAAAWCIHVDVVAQPTPMRVWDFYPSTLYS